MMTEKMFSDLEDAVREMAGPNVTYSVSYTRLNCVHDTGTKVYPTWRVHTHFPIPGAPCQMGDGVTPDIALAALKKDIEDVHQ